MSPTARPDLAIAELEKAAAGGEPFALFLSYGTPHDPWTTDNVPPEYLAQTERGRLPTAPQLHAP